VFIILNENEMKAKCKRNANGMQTKCERNANKNRMRSKIIRYQKGAE